MKKDVIIGIDPGKKGAIAVIDLEENLLEIEKAPELLSQRAELIKSYIKKYNVKIVGLEEVQVMMKIQNIKKADKEGKKDIRWQSPKAMLTFGIDYGVWYGIFLALDLKIETFKPQVWFRKLIGAKKKKTKNETKKLVKEYLMNRIPELRKTKLNLLLYDSIAIALYTKLRYLGGNE